MADLVAMPTNGEIPQPGRIIRDPALLPYYLTPREAANLLRRSVRTLQDYCKAGDLERGTHWIQPRGRQRLFIRDAILAFQRGREERAPEPKKGSICRADLTQFPSLRSAYARDNGL